MIADMEKKISKLKSSEPPPLDPKLLLVDFDGTIYPWTNLFGFPEPLPGAKEFIQARKDEGFEIVIFTSRLSPRWLKSVGHSRDLHFEYIFRLLNRDGIPWDDITAEKVPALYYIDDRAIHFDSWENVTARWEPHI